MTLSEITKYRLVNQKVVKSDLLSPKDIVRWMGAVQAQDFEMSKWAVGIRLPVATSEGIQKALDSGEIIRTHVLRPTWHLVSPDDVSWMLDLTAPHIKTIARSTWKQRGLSKAIFNQCNKLIVKALEQGEHLTRNDIKEILTRAKIDTANNKLSHILLAAELDKLICSGVRKGKSQTYALFEERIPAKKPFTREEGLATLALRYFTSHGPATLKDFIWWSGLSVTNARQALESVKTNLMAETIDSQEYWFHESVSHKDNGLVHLLPAYDEFIIGYRDRSAALTADQRDRVISNNGIFWPVIVVNGKVIGMWKRTIKKDKVIVEPELFSTPDRKTQGSIKDASERFAEFLGLKFEGKL